VWWVALVIGVASVLVIFTMLPTEQTVPFGVGAETILDNWDKTAP
jgi:type IV secretory pathway component VirB8